MRRIDDEMQLNAFLFRNVEETGVAGDIINGDQKYQVRKNQQKTEGENVDDGEVNNVKQDNKAVNFYNAKKNYILQRSQIMVYGYQKRRQRWRTCQNIVIVIMGAAVVVLIDHWLNRSFMERIPQLPIIVAGLLAVALMVIYVCYNRIKYIDRVVTKIYNMTVAYQLGTGVYDSDDMQSNLDRFACGLEECGEMEREIKIKRKGKDKR